MGSTTPRGSAGACGFGYGDGDDATALSDMQKSYVTVFTSRKFIITSGGHDHEHEPWHGLR